MGVGLWKLRLLGSVGDPGLQEQQLSATALTRRLENLTCRTWLPNVSECACDQSCSLCKACWRATCCTQTMWCEKD